jgi:uncharacterized membrane protein
MDKTLELLASKMGVAVDVLWSALLRQALIESTVSVVQIACLCFAIYFYTKHTKIVEECFIPPVIAGWVLLLTISIIAIFSLSYIAAGFFNPEFWALHEIASMFRSGK